MLECVNRALCSQARICSQAQRQRTICRNSSGGFRRERRKIVILPKQERLKKSAHSTHLDGTDPALLGSAPCFFFRYIFQMFCLFNKNSLSGKEAWKWVAGQGNNYLLLGMLSDGSFYLCSNAFPSHPGLPVTYSSHITFCWWQHRALIHHIYISKCHTAGID